jgi:RNA polymerase sigma factor for flagellar operon FliA
MDNLRVMITPKEISLIRRIAAEVYRDCCPAGEAGQITKEDLCHHGVIGLMESKQTYDRSRGVPWIKFAAFRVRGAMMDQLRMQPMIRIPQARQRKVKELKEARNELTRNGMDTRPESLARRLKWSVEEVHKVSGLMPNLIQAEEERTDRENEAAFSGVVLRNDNDDPEALTLKKETAELVQRCLETLPSPQDRLVIVSRVIEGLKLKDLAETLGCSIENIRQWQKRVEKLMRACMERHGWSMEG